MTTKEKDKLQESVLSRVLRSPIFVAASGLSVILVAFALDSVRQSLTFAEMVVAALIFLFIMAMNMIVNATVNKLHNQDYFDSRLEVINNIILSNNLNWLVNQKYVQMLETQADEVWAFAPELTFSIQPGTDIFNAVEATLAKGCRYKIFMPNRPETHKIVSDYMRLHKQAEGQVEFILIPHEDYVFHTIISIYNPHTDRPQAIEWLPVQGIVGWIEMDQAHANRMVGIGEVLIRRYISRGQGSGVKEVPRSPAGSAVVQRE